MYSGPHIKRDGLVFGYDTGYGIADSNTTTRFYSGKPTENLLSLAGADTDLERTGAAPAYSYHSVNITSLVQSRWSASNNKVVQSFEGKRDYVVGGTGGGNDGYPRMYIYFTDWSWSSSFGITSYDWSYNKQIFTMPDPTGKTVFMSIYHMNSQIPGRSYSRKHSVSFDTIDTPYTRGTRSSTQSLIDLTKSTNINVSNVSFDSTGQPTFDGTDDLISVDPGTFPSSWSQPFTVEAIVYIPSSATWYNQGSGLGIVGRGSYTGSWGLMRGSGNNTVYLYIRTGGTTFNPGGTIGRDKYYHIIGTWDGVSQAIFYINGNQNSQETSTNVGTTVDNTGNIVIGGNIAFGGSNGGYGEGTYPVVKLYNRALSPQEVQQNFKAYKNRFNL